MTTDTDVISIDMLGWLLAIQNELNEGQQGRLQHIKSRLVELIYQYAPQERDQQARVGQPLKPRVRRHWLNAIQQQLC